MGRLRESPRSALERCHEGIFVYRIFQVPKVSSQLNSIAIASWEHNLSDFIQIESARATFKEIFHIKTHLIRERHEILTRKNE